jgi:hypothetical protein
VAVASPASLSDAHPLPGDGESDPAMEEDAKPPGSHD